MFITRYCVLPLPAWKIFICKNIIGNRNFFSESERLCTTSYLRNSFYISFSESKTVFEGDTMLTARQISNIQGCNSRALHYSGFSPDISNFVCYTWIMIYTLKPCFLAVAYQTWQMLLHRRT